MHLACLNVLSDYCSNLDTWHATDNLQYFTPDARWTVYDGREAQPVIDLTGSSQLAEWFAKRDAAASRRTRHFIGNVFCESDSPRTGRLTSLALVFHLPADLEDRNLHPRNLVEYRDEVRQGDDGRWRFSTRLTTILAGVL